MKKAKDRKRRHEYEGYVVHPRFGQGPRFTGLDVDPSWLHRGHIPGTAIEADWSKQNFSTMGVSHYYDLNRKCSRCQCPFIFFAEEQKFWYEELHLRLEVSPDCCHDCRRHKRGVDHSRERYEELFHVRERSPQEDAEMAEHCLLLMEEEQFSPRKSELVRMLIKRVSARKAKNLRTRLEAFEAKCSST